MKNAKQGTAEILLTMEEELGLLDDLLGFARDKARLLSLADAEGLSKTLTQEEETIVSLREKEETRKKEAQRIAKTIGIPDGSPTLRELAEGTGDAEFARCLTDADSRMLRAMRALNRQGEKVRGLLKHQVRYTEFMLGVLSRPGVDTHFYNVQGGREEQSVFFSRLDYHA